MHDILVFSPMHVLTYLLVSVLVKVGSRSSVYCTISQTRKTGSYIYEDFMPTDGTDVKVRHVCAGKILCLIMTLVYIV